MPEVKGFLEVLNRFTSARIVGLHFKVLKLGLTSSLMLVMHPFLKILSKKKKKKNPYSACEKDLHNIPWLTKYFFAALYLELEQF